MVAVRRVHLDFYRDRANFVATTAARRLVIETVTGTNRLARVTSPVKTGRLRASHLPKVDTFPGRVVGEVVATADHAAPQHEGARPHLIRPKRPGGVLVFRVGGRLVITKLVRHPGNPARPWLYEALLISAGRRGFRVTRR